MGGGVVLAGTYPEQLLRQSDHGNILANLIGIRKTAVGRCHSCHEEAQPQQRRTEVMAFAPLSTISWGVSVRQSEAEALALRLLNLVPPLIQEPKIEVFGTLKDAEQALGMDIALPAYFPDYFLWPPAKIVGQRQPVRGVSLTFLSRDKGQEALWIRQVSPSHPSPETLVRPGTIPKDVPVVIKGSQGRRLVVQGEDGNLYHQLSWRKDAGLLIMATTLPAEELLKMAESMNR